jgi:glycosyltransferase involved in cell wall biosynthesis
MPPKVSIVIPVFNRANLLKNAIESVLAQTYSDYELIVADDGSTDGTAELVRHYLEPAHPFHDRISYFHQQNRGKSVALNHALERAKGEWIAFLDSDDVWLPEKLDWQFQALAKFPECGACFTDCQFLNNPHMDTTAFRFFGKSFDQKLQKLPGTLKTILETPFCSMVTLVCRAKLVQDVGGFDPHLRFTEDYDFMFRLATVTDYCFVNMPLVDVDRTNAVERHAESSVDWDKLDFRLRSELYRYEKWLKISEGFPSDVRKIIVGRLRGVHSAWANWYLEKEDYEKAREAMRMAAQYQLTPNLLAKWVLTLTFPHLAKRVMIKRGGYRPELY